MALFNVVSWQHLLIIALIIIPYFIPSMIAFIKNKPNKIAILVLNTFLGWSMVGWVISLVWSLTSDKIQNLAFDNSATPYLSKFDKLEKLNHLKLSGILTEQEFIIEKQKLLQS